MVSQIIWGSSHWGREQSCYLWGPKQKWAHRNLMNFPRDRCKVLDPGQNNDVQLDRLGAGWPETALQKRTWGSWWTRSWTSVGTGPYDKEGWSCPGYVSKIAVSRLEELICLISSALVRSHLECCAQFRPPQYHTDVLEEVQWRTTKGRGHLEHRRCKGTIRVLRLSSL